MNGNDSLSNKKIHSHVLTVILHKLNNFHVYKQLLFVYTVIYNHQLCVKTPSELSLSEDEIKIYILKM